MSFPSETLQCDLVGLPVPRQILCKSKSQAVFRLMQQREVANVETQVLLITWKLFYLLV